MRGEGKRKGWRGGTRLVKREGVRGEPGRCAYQIPSRKFALEGRLD